MEFESLEGVGGDFIKKMKVGKRPIKRAKRDSWKEVG